MTIPHLDRRFVRCFAEPVKGGQQWQAFSLEFGLAVQGDTFNEVKSKMDAIVRDYVYDAVVGEDRQYRDELLNRRAHWRVYARYYVANAAHVLLHRLRRVKTFKEPLSVQAAHCV